MEAIQATQEADRWITFAEAAKHTGKSARCLRFERQKGRLPSEQRRIRLDKFNKFLRKKWPSMPVLTVEALDQQRLG